MTAVGVADDEPRLVTALEGVTVRRGGRRVLDDVGFRVLTGDRLVVVSDTPGLEALAETLRGGRRRKRRAVEVTVVPDGSQTMPPARPLRGDLEGAFAAVGLDAGLAQCTPAQLPRAFAAAAQVAVALAAAGAMRAGGLVVLDRLERLDPWLRAAVARWCAGRLGAHGVVALTSEPEVAATPCGDGTRLATHLALILGGAVIEAGPAMELALHPATPGTRAWFSAGATAPPLPWPGGGCAVAAVCPSATPMCADTTPQRMLVAPDHVAACHLLRPPTARIALT